MAANGPLGNAANWIDSSGALLDHAQYDAFGRRLDADAIDAAFEWTARYRDPITGLQYNDHRWYNPVIQRWMSEDPIGFAGGDANLSRYVGNAPSKFIDRDGTFPIIPIGAALFAAWWFGSDAGSNMAHAPSQYDNPAATEAAFRQQQGAINLHLIVTTATLPIAGWGADCGQRIAAYWGFGRFGQAAGFGAAGAASHKLATDAVYTVGGGGYWTYYSDPYGNLEDLGGYGIGWGIGGALQRHCALADRSPR